MTADPVGYGFVIRGSRPVYVHSVDHSGPAAEAGLQVSIINNFASYVYIILVRKMILLIFTKCQCITL